MKVEPLHLVYPAVSYTPRRIAVFRDHLLAELGGTPMALRRDRRRS